MGWRGDVRDSFKTGLATFMAANPSLVEHVYRARPAAITDRKTIFVGGIEEEHHLDSGTWQRIALVTLVCTRTLGDNAEAIDDIEDLADALADYLADPIQAHLCGDHTEQHPVRTTTTEITDGGTFLPAVVVISQATIQQGRT